MFETLTVTGLPASFSEKKDPMIALNQKPHKNPIQLLRTMPNICSTVFGGACLVTYTYTTDDYLG